MPALTLIAGLFFGPLVDALGSPDYHARAAADSRLSAAGWLAYPALLDGLASACPERADRCGRLIERLPTAAGVLARGTDRAAAGVLRSAGPVPELTPDAWLLLEPAVCRAAERAGAVRVPNGPAAVYVLTDGYGTWCRSRPFLSGSHGGDVRLLAEGVRRGTRTDANPGPARSTP